jgi:hypothetical protein
MALANSKYLTWEEAKVSAALKLAAGNFTDTQDQDGYGESSAILN